MLYFSKLKFFIIYFVIIFLSLFSFLNFINLKDSFISSKKVNLGLDLQGGSYLLLEVDSNPIINQNLQQKVLNLRKYLKENKIKYQNLELLNQSIIFQLMNDDVIKFEKLFTNKDNQNNLYYRKYMSFEMDYSTQNVYLRQTFIVICKYYVNIIYIYIYI